MDGSLLLQLADKYGVDYTLEQAVLVSTWESFIEELESRVKKFKDIEMDLYDEIPITSDWRHFWILLSPMKFSMYWTMKKKLTHTLTIFLT